MANGILILAEHLKGELSDITFEMLGAGRKLADELHVPLHAVVIGTDCAALGSRLGLADKVLVVEAPQLEVPPPSTVAALLKSLIEREQAALVLVGWTNLAIGVGSVLSVRANLPYVNFCRAIRVEGGSIVLTSQLYGGKIFADVPLPGGRGIISVAAGAFPVEAGRSDKAATVEKVDLPVEAPAVSFRRFIEPEAGDVDITKQDVLVSVGRGIQTQDNITLAEDLAQLLGGVVSSSRPVVDQGWLPMSRQVGKSGMTVAPKLYLALGISGAPEHQEGMRAAQLIVAVNTDAKAPIFDVAHYGTTVDLFELIEPLKAALAERKAGK
jgi:electron transfer flavoprotein alpha subunit